MELSILARGPDWVVVDKPPGLAVHRSARAPDRDTVMRFARRQLGPDVDPVHRLDRATSGCLLLSLDRTRTAALHAAHATAGKRYLALVRGWMREAARCERPLNGEDGTPKPAVTVFTPIAGGPEPRATLVLAEPTTGRFHQIRRHLRDLSHPVLGDSSHGDTRVNQVWRRDHGLARLALHCAELRVDGVAVRSPVPADLRAVLARLPWWEAAHLDALELA